VDCGGCVMVVRPSEACCPEPYPAEGLVRFGCIGEEAVSLFHITHLSKNYALMTSIPRRQRGLGILVTWCFLGLRVKVKHSSCPFGK
jgi:hypothetical protein